MDTGPQSHAAPSRRLRRALFFTAGSLSLAVGMVGVAVPVLPTTPFLILAAMCYARSSDRFYCWLVANRIFGRHLDDYLHGRGVSWRVKASSLLFLWAVITVTAVVFVHLWWARALLFVVAVGVTAHIVGLKNRARDRAPDS